MSSKTVMLVFLPVAVLCILALVWDGQGGESVATPTLVEDQWQLILSGIPDSSFYRLRYEE